MGMKQLVIEMGTFLSLVAPLVGIAILLRKNQNRTTVSLLMVNIGTLIMNGAFSFMINSGSVQETVMSVKLSYIGNGVFTLFFICFTAAYLHNSRFLKVFYVYSVYEIIYIFNALWNDPFHLTWHESTVSYDEFLSSTILVYRFGILHYIRYFILITIGIVGLLYLANKYRMTPLARERKNLRRLASSQVIILIVAFLRLFWRNSFDLIPLALSIAIFIIDLGVLKGHFLRITDMGREWVFNNIDHAFVIVDSTYRFLDCNAEAIRIFPVLKNYPQEKGVPADVLNMFSSHRDTVLYNDCMYTRMVLDITQENVVTGHAMIMDDVTERMKLISQLRDEKGRADEANKAKSNFVSTISHEIRTPMNAIVGITDILLRKKRDKEDTDYLMNIKSSGDALLLIINDILDYSKIEAGQMTIVEDEYMPAAMLSDMHMMFVTRIGSKPVELKYDIMEDLPGKLWGDALRIRQIIVNFMNNAIKFTEKGSVTLSVRPLSESENSIILEFAVTDTGQGIRKEDISKLFDSFSQVDERKNHSKEGTGLGLAICKQLAEIMGGEIGVESTYGVGSKFYFRIPQRIIQREPIKEIHRTTDEVIDFEAPDCKLLLVDDNEMNIKVALGLLGPLRMQIDTVNNGKKAVEAVKSKKYDLVFMDHMMPVMDGVEATKIIRSLENEYFRKLPIIALSANVTEEARDEFSSCGMKGFLAKPIKMKEVCKLLLDILPGEMIQPVTLTAETDMVEELVDEPISSDSENELSIEGLDVAAGIENCGTRELFLNLLGDFYKYIDSKAAKIEKCLGDHLLRDYTVEVHALKNTSRMIGALELSEEFKHLEELGNKEDEEQIRELTPGVLAHLRSYKPILEPFGKASNENKVDVSKDEIAATLQKIYDAMDSFDLDGADEALKELSGYRLPETLVEKGNTLDALIADVAIEDSMYLCQEMIDEIMSEEA